MRALCSSHSTSRLLPVCLFSLVLRHSQAADRMIARLNTLRSWLATLSPNTGTERARRRNVACSVVAAIQARLQDMAPRLYKKHLRKSAKALAAALNREAGAPGTDDAVCDAISTLCQQMAFLGENQSKGEDFVVSNARRWAKGEV